MKDEVIKVCGMKISKVSMSKDKVTITLSCNKDELTAGVTPFDQIIGGFATVQLAEYPVEMGLLIRKEE